MAQINVNSNPTPTYDTASPAPTTPVYDNASGARAAATNNLTWAIASVLIIAAIAIAIVYVVHNVHP